MIYERLSALNFLSDEEAVHKVCHVIIDKFNLSFPLSQTGTNLGGLPPSKACYNFEKQN